MELNNLIAVAIINSIIHTALFQPFTVVKKDSTISIQNILNQVQVNGFPTPDLKATLADNSINGEKYFDEIGTSNMYKKKIGRVNYRITPSNLLSQNEFWFNESLRNHFFKYPLLYRADTAILISDTAALLSQSKKVVVVDDSSLKSAVDTLQQSNFTSSVKRFTPGEWILEIESPSNGFYTLFQNHYPRWKLKIDGKEEKLFKSDISFLGFQVPAGKHVVQLSYASLDLKIAFIISCLTLITILVLFLIRN